MTVAALTSPPRVVYTGDGSTTEWTIPFPFSGEEEDLTITLTDGDGVESTPSGDINASSNWVADTAYSSAYTITIARSTRLQQQLGFDEGDDFPLEVVEQSDDLLVQMIQDLDGRCLKFPLTASPDVDNVLPDLSSDGYVMWDASAEAFVFVSTVAPATATISPFAETILDDASAAAVLTTLGISAFAQTLLDDPDAATARTTLGISTSNDFSSGDKVLCMQATSPTGWTKITAMQDRSMIIINSDADGTALDDGGAADPTIAHTHTGPSHQHGAGTHTHTYSGTVGLPTILKNNVTVTASAAVADDEHLHTYSGTTAQSGGSVAAGGTGATGANTQPYYQEGIVCEKD